MPEVVGGVTLVPPRRAGDCACTFCGLYRAHHYWVRAVFASAVATLLVLAPGYIGHEVERNSTPGDATVVMGALMLVATGAVFLTVGSWLQPIRRLLHIARPRASADGQPARAAAGSNSTTAESSRSTMSAIAASSASSGTCGSRR